MKILMLHDCAYVSLELAKELVNLGVDVSRILYHNKLGFSLTKGFNLLMMLWQTKQSDCDLVHSHYLGPASTIAYLSGKPYIVHVHGSDVRNKHLSTVQKKVLKKSKAIVYATEDSKPFLPEHAIYIETPVGKQFRNLHKKRNIKTAYRTLRYESPEQAVDLMINGLKYEDMPKILNNVERFYDRHTIDNFSKTGLEALACGCTVINNGCSFKGLPKEHEAVNVAKKLERIYSNVINA